jgi:superfamily II DNA or RNA helicase
MVIELYPHQQEAYEAWVKNRHLGCLKLATATGKTFLGLNALQQLNCATLIVVPTIALQNQWAKEIKKNLKLETTYYGGGKKETSKITIAIIDSLREILFNTDLLILDEVHRFMSSKNYESIKNSNYKYLMALSATPERTDGKHELLYDIAPKCFEYSREQAIEDGVISDFDEDVVYVKMSEKTEVEYKEVDSKFKAKFAKFGHDLARMSGESQRGDLDAINGMRYMARRKEIIYNAPEKIDAAKHIIDMYDKCIVFSESIESLEMLAERLPNCVKYHSAIKKKEKEEAIRKFTEDEKCVLLSVKALDEGLNCPEVAVAIVMSGTSSKRQYSQRLGRILRKKEEIGRAHV